MLRLLRLFTAAASVLAAMWIVLTAGLPDRARVNAVFQVRPGETPIAPEVGALAPPIEGQDVRGQRFSLAALRGSPVVINFWATWCGPCVAEMPALQAAYEAHRADRLHIVGIDLDEPAADVLNWLEHFGLTHEIVIDRSGRLSALYLVRGLPSTYFVGRDGIIREIAYGPLSDRQIKAAIQGLLR